ncbi:MAG: hypothetical protein RL653_3992 [Pseudomonadota bacterium]|jgi:hypothetical protein
MAVLAGPSAWAGRRGGFVRGYVTKSGKVVSPHYRGPSLGLSLKVKPSRSGLKKVFVPR